MRVLWPELLLMYPCAILFVKVEMPEKTERIEGSMRVVRPEMWLMLLAQLQVVQHVTAVLYPEDISWFQALVPYSGLAVLLRPDRAI